MDGWVAGWAAAAAVALAARLAAWRLFVGRGAVGQVLRLD